MMHGARTRYPRFRFCDVSAPPHVDAGRTHSRTVGKACTTFLSTTPEGPWWQKLTGARAPVACAQRMRTLKNHARRRKVVESSS
jgi:hypothetical protein